MVQTNPQNNRAPQALSGLFHSLQRGVFTASIKSLVLSVAELQCTGLDSTGKHPYCQRGTQQGMKGDTPVNSTMSVGQARKLVEQLKIEASFCRIKVSKAAADLMAYCDAHACEDPLITPVPTSENPFREKKFFCALL
ncbi:hypothetical protein Q7C36_018028 [Tachysurus vachellii]|uniref:Guanine nucleotide-binding protein subunit gamma n=1 Tax=Tachysurus vachellii TaxID=175792 RepID=A0AA88M079_TACVA|nr:hypothetical protein Q7C36_018028 [Tachysurus vachellii]